MKTDLNGETAAVANDALFGLKIFERDKPKCSRFMADLVTSKSGHTFSELVDLAWARRNKRKKNCGEEIFRLRAFDSLQCAVACGQCRKDGKIYLPNAKGEPRR